MFVLVGIPLLLVAVSACLFVASLILGFVLLRTRHRLLSPFLFFVPTFGSAFAVLLAWPVAYLLDRADPQGGYFRLLLGFPVGAFSGSCVGLIPAFVMRRVMKRERL
jgi:hypothetical protein